jgi:hypothetical protein
VDGTEAIAGDDGSGAPAIRMIRRGTVSNGSFSCFSARFPGSLAQPRHESRGRRDLFRPSLELKSGPFFACYKFFVEPNPFETFVAALRSVYSTLAGEARLQPLYEPQFVLIKSASSGHMDVSGELIEHGAGGQRLKFAFRSDQSCVGLFLEELRPHVVAHAF